MRISGFVLDDSFLIQNRQLLVAADHYIELTLKLDDTLYPYSFS